MDTTLPTASLDRDQRRSAAVAYGGGILFGVAVTAFAVADRGSGAAFLAGTLLLAGSTAWLLYWIARRPAVADDGASLRLDSRFRDLDARRISMPYPVVLAVVMAVSTGPPLRWIFLGYAVATVVADVALAPRPSRAGTSRGPPQ